MIDVGLVLPKWAALSLLALETSGSGDYLFGAILVPLKSIFVEPARARKQP
jgi:hypothetical protein